MGCRRGRFTGGHQRPRRITNRNAQWQLRFLRDVDDLGVKEVAAIAGESPAWESPSAAQPFVFDSDVVGRLRAAGAVVIGTTRTPQYCLFPMTDDADAIVANPWAPDYSAGGSSGGSAAAGIRILS
jgi:Asp-tRNA(Asn)/Glu-tRNA(Gln) amidotransferase A subunit family amidase